MAYDLSFEPLPQEAPASFAKLLSCFLLFGSQVYARSIDIWRLSVFRNFVAQHEVMQQVPHSIKVLCLSIIFVD